MADLILTPGLVVPTKDKDGNTTPLFPGSGKAGEAITQGQPVYRAADGLLYRCDADDADQIKSRAVGITISAGSAGQWVHYWCLNDDEEINLGATLVVGMLYVVSANVGGIAPITDYTTGWNLTTLCYATTAALAKTLRKYTNVTRA